MKGRKTPQLLQLLSFSQRLWPCLSSAEEQLQPLLGADQGRRGAAGTGQALAPALESAAVSAAGTAMQETSVLFPLRVAAPPHGWGLPGNKFHW